MDTLSPFLIDAKREYLARMTDALTPIIVFKEFKRMYDAAQKARGDKALLIFQRDLQKIQSWNAGTVREKTQAIENKYSWLSQLIAMLFVSFIKVMSSVRVTNTDRPNIRLKLPTNDVFIHKVYVETARAYYENPYLIRRNDTEVHQAIVQKAIETTVRDELPLQDILEAYLGKSVDGDGTMAPILSPVHSEDEDAEAAPADDSTFDRAAQYASSSSSSESDDEEPQEPAEPKYIHMAGPSTSIVTPAAPPPSPTTVPQAPQLPPPQLPTQPMAHTISPQKQQQQQPSHPPHVPQAPPTLFQDATGDEHFG